MIQEIILEENKISFDFDGTLDDDFDGTPNSQKEEIQSICKQLIEQGKDVCIITKRYGHPQHGECGKVYELANQLGVKQVYFTDRVLKHEKVFELGIEVHFENAEYECDVIQQKNPSTLLIHVEDTYWRDLVY